jgi:hypothetical protein
MWIPVIDLMSKNIPTGWVKILREIGYGLNSPCGWDRGSGMESSPVVGNGVGDGEIFFQTGAGLGRHSPYKNSPLPS